MSKSNIIWTTELLQRFMGYVDKTDSCWIWKAGKFGNGYGQFRAGKKKVRAHRFAYTALVGPIPDGMNVCHSCDNPLCVNPEHLWLGADKQNIADRDRKGRTGDGGSAMKKLFGLSRGENNTAAKINEGTVLEIREEHQSQIKVFIIFVP